MGVYKPTNITGGPHIVKICLSPTKIFRRNHEHQTATSEFWLGSVVLNGIDHIPNIWNDTLWLFNIAMENGPFIDGLPGFTY